MNKSRENQISPIPHGLQPGQARQDHPVLAPEARNKGGRPKGSQNKITATFRDAMMLAAQETGDSQEVGKDGEGGLLGYLKVCSVLERKTFMLMMARVLPMKISAEVKQMRERMSIGEAVAELKACGLDELLALYFTRYPLEPDELDEPWAKMINLDAAPDPLAPKSNGTGGDDTA
jgi:hypothetical protein